MSCLKVQALSKNFGGKSVLKDINFQISEKEFVIIAGKNGSGKTVLMMHLNGLFSAEKGRVLLDEQNIQGNLNKTRSKIGIVFQEATSQIFCQTVEDEISFALEMNKDELAKQKTKSILKKLSLYHLRDISPFHISAGELKKVTIGAVLAQEPEIIILDEPFIGLDYLSVKMVLKAIINLHKMGQSIILITHDLEKVLFHSSRLIVLNKGKIVYDGHPQRALDSLENWGIKRPRTLKTATWLQ